MRVLGIDPGTIRCGWGVVRLDGGRLEHLASGVLEVGRGDISTRLAAVHAGLCAVLDEHRPDAMGLERNFVARNVQSAFRLGEARGVALAAAASFGVVPVEYTPMRVKKAVVGYGQADKAQVQACVARILGLASPPASDAADALAAAICHALASGFERKVSSALAATTAPAGRTAPRGATKARAGSWRALTPAAAGKLG